MQKIFLVFTLTFMAAVAAADAVKLKSSQDMLNEAKSRTQSLDTDQLQRLLNENPDLVLIDVRMPSDIESMGYIDVPQQTVIPRGWLEFRIANHVLDRDTKIVTYCGGGLRSTLAADTLQQMGYTDVWNYEEGFITWKQRGLPVATGN